MLKQKHYKQREEAGVNAHEQQETQWFKINEFTTLTNINYYNIEDLNYYGRVTIITPTSTHANNYMSM